MLSASLNKTFLSLSLRVQSSPNQMKSKHLSLHSKKPIRPVDRQKMGPWLKNLLDHETCPGLVWVDRSHRVFQVSWRHRARMGWDMKLDGDVFERWARHTGQSPVEQRRQSPVERCQSPVERCQLVTCRTVSVSHL